MEHIHEQQTPPARPYRSGPEKSQSLRPVIHINTEGWSLWSYLNKLPKTVTKAGLHLAKGFHFQTVLFLFKLESQFVLRLSSPENSGNWRNNRSRPAVFLKRDWEASMTWPQVKRRVWNTPYSLISEGSKELVQFELHKLIPFFHHFRWGSGSCHDWGEWAGKGTCLRVGAQCI